MKRNNNNNNNNKLTRSMLRNIAQSPAAQHEILQFCKEYVVNNIKETYLPDFVDLVNKMGNQLGRLPRYPNLTVQQLLALKPESITDTLLLPAASENNAKPAIFGQLDPQLPRKPDEVYLIPRPLLTSKTDGLFSSLVAAYVKLVDDVSTSAQTYRRIAGGTYETLEKRAITLANDNAKYDICHGQIFKIKAEFAKEFNGYAIYKDKYILSRTKIEEFGRKIDELSPLSNDDEKALLVTALQSLENLFCLTYLEPFSDSNQAIHFSEGYFENNTLKHRYATPEVALSNMVKLQDFFKNLKSVQTLLNKIDKDVRERMQKEELARQAKEKPVQAPVQQRTTFNDDVPAPKLVLKRWQLPTPTDVVSSSGSSSLSSEDSDPKEYVFKGINLGPDPVVIENAEGFDAYLYLDTKSLDAQDFDYRPFQSLQRLKFAPDEGQPGIKKISMPLNLRWSFNNQVQDSLLHVGHELKVIGIPDRILLAQIPGEGRETLYVGLVGVPGGLHNNGQKERLTSMVKNQVFEITSPYPAETSSKQSLKL